uniref:Uncharacterized protein n=1 Tax=Arundo donax TaxID=35708 RepID=A0A0A8YCG0_ARUDO
MRKCLCKFNWEIQLSVRQLIL